MSEKTTDNKLPYTCTSAYDRNAARAASVPPAMNRNSATGAAAAKISRSARSAAMLMRVHTIISPLFLLLMHKKSEYRCRCKWHTILRLYYEIILSAYSCSKLSASGFFCLFLLSLIPQLICSLFHAGCIFITFAAKMLCTSPVTEDQWISRPVSATNLRRISGSPALGMDEACSCWKAGYHDKPGKSGSSVRPEEKYLWYCSLNNGWIHKAPHHHLH